MYQKILVALDGSKTSQLALLEAIKLAKNQNAKLCMLHVVDELPNYYVPYGGDLIKYQEYYRECGQEILCRMKQCAQEAGITPQTQLIEITQGVERISEKILEYALANQIDLIVIGTHGRRGLNHFLLGSVAEAVIRTAPVPILLVRGNE